MYVIFPADEIILFSYGAIVPRLQPRPTLDNLREPLVPPGTRPQPTASNLDVTQSNTIFNKKTSVSSYSNSQQPSPKPSKPRRDRSPNITFADDCNYFPFPKSEPDEENVSETDYLARSNLLDPITPSLSEYGATNDNNFNFNNYNNANNQTDTTSGKKKNKLKSKIHISLGRLGRPHSNEQTESQQQPQPSRVREDLDIRVSNPTFTSDNLRQKNFDAFFASGEPVYSLERKFEPEVPASPSIELKPTQSTTSLLGNRLHSSSLAKLNKASNFKPQSVPPSPTTPQYSIGSTERPKSAEFLRGVEQSQKGDRCPFKKFLMNMKCWFLSINFIIFFYFILILVLQILTEWNF